MAEFLLVQYTVCKQTKWLKIELKLLIKSIFLKKQLLNDFTIAIKDRKLEEKKGPGRKYGRYDGFEVLV